jgi:hypothetical protein
MPFDPVALTADLVRCPSVTLAEGGASVLLGVLLTEDHDVFDDEKELIAPALEENSVIVAQMTPFFDEAE